jgi:hypothetical protein
VTDGQEDRLRTRGTVARFYQNLDGLSEKKQNGCKVGTLQAGCPIQ